MNEVTLPPSPNWYLSTTLACTEDGTIAWASKNTLIIGKRGSNDHKTLSYKYIPNTHTERINSLSFCPDYGKERTLIVTSGNDHVLKSWDTEKMEMTSSKSYLDSDQKAIAIDWSKSDPNLICAISIQGVLLTWQYSFNTHQIIPLGKITATCLTCSPHKSNLIAIGTKIGLIYIVNIQGNGTINYKLRGHDYEITSLSWCPTAVNLLNDSCQKDYLLASGAKDRSIFIWKAGTDGRVEAQVTLPNGPHDNSQHRSKLNSNVGAFTVVLWIEPNFLVVSSNFGELLSLKLSSIRKKQKPELKLIHGCHSRAIFSIASFVKPIESEEIGIVQASDDENWRTEKEEMITENREIWTTGQERQIVCVKPGEDDNWKINYNIPTLAGFVYCISPCPLDTSLIAFGVGDGILRVWNLSEPHETTFDLTTVWQKIMGRISSISWHPEKENLLAYGTTEGRIGVYDTCNYSRAPVLFKQHHRKTIYRLEWGPSPPNEKKQSTYSLYCCGDGELTCFNYEKPQDKPMIIFKKQCSEFSWKPDYSCMAVGHDDGSITFLNKKLESTGKTIFLLKKPIECLAWHPDSTVTDWNYSHYRDYLAVSSTHPTITIFDMSGLIKKLTKTENKKEEEEEIGENFYKVVANLSGHSERIFCLNWSPHISGYLVSGSSDKLVQVWKIDEQKAIATYTGHDNGVYSVMWSPLDQDLIMSGSSDCTLRIWRLSDQKVFIPAPEAIVQKTKTKKKKKTAVKIEKNKLKEAADSDENDEVPEINSLQTVKEKKPKGKKAVTYFPILRKEANNKESVLKSCMDLAKQVKNGESCESLFGSKDQVTKIMRTEVENHWSQGHSMMTVEMSLWSNSLKETLLKAVESHSLTDFMVSLAPSLSMKVWQEMCEAYANQLIQEGNPSKAVSYLLVIHKIHQAINVLMGGKMFREAYAIARCKLDADDGIFKELIEEWSSSSLKCGLFEDAAQCAIYNGDFCKGAKLLARRKDVLTLETAAELAEFGDDKELSESIAEQALDAALSELNYEKSRQLLEKFACLRYRCLQIEAYEEIRKKFNEDFQVVSVVSWLSGESSYGLIEEVKKKHEELTKIHDFSLFYKKLEGITYPPLLAVNESRSCLWLVISRDIALSALAPSEEKMVKHIVTTLGGIAQYELMNSSRTEANAILVRFLSILEAKSPSSNESIYHFDDKEKVAGVYKSLRVYLCLGLLNWLIDVRKSGDFEEIPVKLIIKFISESIEFILDVEIVKYWMTMAEITKLENLLSTSRNEGEIKDGNNDNVEGDMVNQENLLKRLAETRIAQKKFIDERVCAPSPMLAYSKATELASLLDDGEIKSNFMEIVVNAWRKATSFPSEE